MCLKNMSPWGWLGFSSAVNIALFSTTCKLRLQKLVLSTALVDFAGGIDLSRPSYILCISLLFPSSASSCSLGAQRQGWSGAGKLFCGGLVLRAGTGVGGSSFRDAGVR